MRIDITHTKAAGPLDLHKGEILVEALPGCGVPAGSIPAEMMEAVEAMQDDIRTEWDVRLTGLGAEDVKAIFRALNAGPAVEALKADLIRQSGEPRSDAPYVIDPTPPATLMLVDGLIDLAALAKAVGR